MHPSTVAIALAKEVFELAFADAQCWAIERKRRSRRTFIRPRERCLHANAADPRRTRYTAATVPLPRSDHFGHNRLRRNTYMTCQAACRDGARAACRHGSPGPRRYWWMT